MIAFLRNMPLRRLFFSRSEIDQTLLLSGLFSLAILSVRILYTGSNAFWFLSWNLFLAYIPYAISKNWQQQVRWQQSNGWFFGVLGVWLLFIPNTFYILTDLFHLNPLSAMPLWFDLALLLSFAWNGFLLGVVSVRQVERLLALKWNSPLSAVFIYAIMFLNAFGIYIGRYLRFNSWDVVANPFGLAQDVLYVVLHPVRHRFDWSMIVCYAVFMTLMYTAIKRLSKALF